MINKIRKWFDIEVCNWYEEHIPESNEEDSDYLYMDEYESNVIFEQPNRLLFFGFCTGHYETEGCNKDKDLTENFYYDLERMERSLTDCNIKIGEHITLDKDNDNNIIVTLKNIALDEFINCIS